MTEHFNEYDEIRINAYELDFTVPKHFVCKYCKLHFLTLEGCDRHLESKHNDIMYKEACKTV